MLLSIFMILLCISVLFFILMVHWESLSLGILDVVLWFILSASVFTIEIPYVAITSEDVVVSGIQVISSLYYIGPLFMVIGIITLLFWLTRIVFPMLGGKINKMM